MLIIRIFLIVIFFLVYNHTETHAQNIPEKFTHEHQTFINELNLIFQSLPREELDKSEFILDTFNGVWNAEILLEDEKQLIYKTMDMLLALQLKPYPDFITYLDAVVKILQTPNKKQNFKAWHQSFSYFTDQSQTRKLTEYWQKSIALFEKNILFESSSVKWYLRDTNYSLDISEGELILSFQENDLVCVAQNDSTTIYKTNGKVNFLQEKLQGQRGKMTWERVLLDPQKVYAELSDYLINLSVARFEADTVTFYNTNFFQEPLTGKLTERILAEVKPSNARYPRFTSYKAIHVIEDLFPEIDFLGGFTMMGQRVLGSGTDKVDATIHFYRNDSLFISAQSRAFSIRQDRISSERAEVSIYMSGDSIYHPSINMRYLNDIREFSMQREEKGFSRAPFSNTYHSIDMYCEAIYWKMETVDIELRMIRSMSETGQAFFESHDFFSDMRYMKLQGISGLHPLIKIRNFADKFQSDTFPVIEYARHIGGSLAGVQAQLLSLSYYGFLLYDHEKEEVMINNRLRHYIGAHVGKNDFDVIRINSEAAMNARINMNNFDLELFGVEQIPLSDSKNVVIHPFDQKLVMKKNRDMYFKGRIQSGLFDFYGQEFLFDYSNFKIDLINTDSMSFRVRSFEKDRSGQYSLERVRTVLEGINGELLVDHPRNKSGQLPYPRFPIFNSNNESFVYYDRENIQEGVYDRDDVFFKLIPFSIDSLDNATTDNIAFDGVFVSTGIFPDFYDYLTVQEDYSLGFNTQTPQDGYPVYGDKALYKGPIDMSYEGLRADGELQYLNSTIMAEEMLLFPDSARGKIHIFNITTQQAPVEYPEVSAKNVDMFYLPHEDNMNISNKDEKIEIFGGLAMLNGSVDMTPEGLLAEGSIEFFGGEMASNQFDFNQWDFVAEDSNLKILTRDENDIALEAQNYKAFVDIQNQQTNMTSLGNNSQLSFRLNRYDAFGFDFDWDMDEGALAMENEIHEDIQNLGNLTEEEWITHDFSGFEMISQHPSQDDLSFYAGVLNYDIDENIIFADHVKIIKVADAAIYPDEEKVEILPRAEMRELRNSVVLANTQTLYHRFYEANVNIATRWSYAGEGKYDYVDNRGNVQTILFNEIEVDRALKMTIASSYIVEEQDFTISPEFEYQGALSLEADQKDYFYKGAVNMVMDCPNYDPNWIKFESKIQRDSIYIPLAEELQNSANGRIFTSMMIAGDSLHPYPAVFTRKNHYSDLAMITSTGFLHFDAVEGVYRIASEEKFLTPDIPGNTITINPKTCIIEGNGEITLAEDFGQFKTSQFGKVTHDLYNDKLTLDLVMGIDFFFLNSALARMEESVRNSETTRNLNLNSAKYRDFLRLRTGLETSTRLLEEYTTDGEFRRFPEELDHTIMFADVKLEWNKRSQSFVSTEPLGLGNMETFPINLYVDGYIELERERSGNVFTLLLVPSGYADEGIGVDWYFFTYSNGIMQTIASDTEFNTMVRSLKPNRRRMDVERGEEPFSFILSGDRRPFIFLRNMKMYQEEL